jgi:N-acetylglucosaminyl-diphospho-decaprenol L-rhamnosyltransferase
MIDLAIVVVHYRTERLLVEAVQALRADLDCSGLRAEIVVVDNGSEPSARSEWSALPVVRIDPGSNLGYAGGVRCGVDATAAPLVVAMNPDVLVGEGCLGRLLAELDRGAAAAGPLFAWDRGQRLLLPPTEMRSAAAELRAALARRLPSRERLARAVRRSWRRHARRHWEATAPFASTALSGALLAFRREAWHRIGPFDETFQLYYEETDWLLRLRAAGLESRFVPAARAVHLFAQSSVQEPRATAWFGEAERRFRRRHLGAGTTKLLELLGAPAAPPSSHRAAGALATAAVPTLDLARLATPQPPTWIEIALSPAGFPAAGERLEASSGTGGEWRFPDEIWRRLPPGELWLRGVDESGGESAAVRVLRIAEGDVA